MSEYPNAQEDRERPDQRYRNGDDMNDGGSPALEEDDHDQHDEGNRLEQGVANRVDRLRDELGSGLDDSIFEPGREALRHGFHLGLDRGRCGQGVRAGTLNTPRITVGSPDK